MASLEDELRDLKQRNNDLVQKVQYWKMLAGQRENEKLDLMKEINELRLKLSRLRSNGSLQASNLEAALQSAAQKALAHLVRASGEIANTMELAKTYIQDREEIDNASPRWSSIGGTPSTAKKDKVHRVPPLMIGGQSIQPVVALTMLDTSIARSAARNSNQNRNVTERAVPMHMLQDVYIPLTRIDVDLQSQNMESEDGNNANDSTGLLQLDDNEENVLEDSQRMEEDEDFDSTRVLDAVTEDTEPENEEESPPRSRIDNPLEGPSWMLDASNNNQANATKPRTNLEPDSTTELEDYRDSPPITEKRNKTEQSTQLVVASRLSRDFSPTVRRRKRTSSPPAATTPRRASQYSPRPPPPRRLSNSGRVLKVLVAKMRLDAEGEVGGSAGSSPPKQPRAASHAPSPNGATVPGLIVSETSQHEESLASGEPTLHKQCHQLRQPLDTSDIDGWMDQDQINTDRQTNRSHEEERTDLEEKPADDDINMEELHINLGRRTNNREHIRQTNLERSNSRERLNSKERDDRVNRERNKQIRDDVEHVEKKERDERTNRKRNMEMQSGSREQTLDRDHSAERSGRRTNSAERTGCGQKQSRTRDQSNERHEDVRTDSRASNDLSQQNDTRFANTSRGRAGSCDSDSGSGGEREGRTRRARKLVTYKEKPLNRKLRR